MEAADTSEHTAPAQTGAARADLPRFAVVDVETSGLSTRRHRLLQIAVITVVGGTVVDEWSTLIKLRWPLSRVGPRRVHGITRASLRGAPRQREALGELARRLDGAVFTAHNVRFDWSFIERAAKRSKVPIRPTHRLCTLGLSRSLDPDRALSHRLGDVCERYGISNDRPHDALHDARATAAALGFLLDAHGVAVADDLDPLYERR
ncbi:MAG: 3'-5' exonuclease [Ilumatobacteraceae bacterium]|nr:3'-5' exonuclease [Ilumatobacteraceae bacterium]